MTDFFDFIEALQGNVFEERPVEIEEFVMEKTFLGLPPLSDNQYIMIKASTQIYKRETLHELYDAEEAEKRWSQTCNEVIFQLGKGSGKDYISTIACAYLVYKLLCLRDPAEYYGKPPGDSFDIINIAINALQANNVFFKNFKKRIEHNPWFAGKYESKAGSIAFDKNITVHSGHSQRESWEGYNVIMVVLDEIAGFDLDSTSGNVQAKTASAIYKMYKASVSSRFPQFGKLLLLSFPRYKGDFIQQRYNEVIASKETIIRKHTMKLDHDLPDGVDGNEFDVSWEEDHIERYAVPRVFALKRPTWEINPTISIDDLTSDFFDDYVDALGRFACMPPDAVDSFFRSKEKIESAFSDLNIAHDDSWRFRDWFTPDDTKTYYIHVDLALKQDRCVVAMAHVDQWIARKIYGSENTAAPKVIVDAIRYWTPSKEKVVDFNEVKEYILALKSRGFNIKLVTFDRWNSFDMMEQLKAYGMNTETLSVSKRHYEDMSLAITEDRLHGPNIPLLHKELLQLRIVGKDKVDHPRTGSKDLADSTCGAIYNAMSRTPKSDRVTMVKAYSDYDDIEDEAEKLDQPKDEIIRIPQKKQMPPHLREMIGLGDRDEEQNFLDNLSII